MFVWLSRKLIIPLLVACVLSPCAAQDAPPNLSALQRSVNEHLSALRHDEAFALLKTAAAESNPPAHVPHVLWNTAQFFRANENYAKAHDLFKLITDRFPDSPIVPFAWCGMGQAHGKLGDNEKMIAALERGISLPRIPPPTPFFDLGDTFGFAHQTLGDHYVTNRQWEKALKTFTDWKPSSWCGTCLDGMQATKTNSILLCHAHLANVTSLTELAWREVAKGSQTYDQVEMFLLTRSYAEAGQLDALQRMVVQLEAKASLKYPLNQSEVNLNRLNVIRTATSALSNAIDNATQKDVQQHIQTLEMQNTQPVLKHVARWSLLRNSRQSAPALKTASLKTTSAKADLLQLLAAIDSLGSRTALVDLASTSDIYQMQNVCDAINHRKDRKELLTKVIARVPKHHASFIDLDSEPTPFPREYRYYESWSPPKPKSLPSSLPERLFDE